MQWGCSFLPWVVMLCDGPVMFVGLCNPWFLRAHDSQNQLVRFKALMEDCDVWMYFMEDRDDGSLGTFFCLSFPDGEVRQDYIRLCITICFIGLLGSL